MGTSPVARSLKMYTDFSSTFSCCLILCDILKKVKSKSSSQIGAFFYPTFANGARVNEPTSVVHVSAIFFQQIVANLP